MSYMLMLIVHECHVEITSIYIMMICFLYLVAMITMCKARYAVLFQIWTFPSKHEDEAHIGPTVTYDEVIYPEFQHDITALQIQGTTSHTIGIQLPEYITSAEDTCLNTDYIQIPSGKGKTHHA